VHPEGSIDVGVHGVWEAGKGPAVTFFDCADSSLHYMHVVERIKEIFRINLLEIHI
jgi:hypothetical protein